MNYFDAKLTKKGDKYVVVSGGAEVELAPAKQKRLAELNVPEQDIILGVRPDHLVVADKGLKGTVDVSELMGASEHLHVTVDGKDCIVIVPNNGEDNDYTGKEVCLTFNGSSAHCFSKETKKNLEYND